MSHEKEISVQSKRGAQRSRIADEIKKPRAVSAEPLPA